MYACECVVFVTSELVCVCVCGFDCASVSVSECDVCMGVRV